MTDNFFMNLDNAVKFFNLRRVSLEINYYVVSFTLMLYFVRKMTFAPFISIVNGTTDSGNGVLYQFDSSLDNFIISCIHNEHNFILFHEIRLLFGPMSRTHCGPGSYLQNNKLIYYTREEMKKQMVFLRNPLRGKFPIRLGTIAILTDRKLFAKGFLSGLALWLSLPTGNYLRKVSYPAWHYGCPYRQETIRKRFPIRLGTMAILTDRKLFA